MKRLLLSLVLMMTLLLAACHREVSMATAMSPSQVMTLQQRINASGAKVIQQGQHVMVVIPTDTYFVAQSTTLRPNRVADMQRIVRFVKQYANTTQKHSVIRISGFTDKVFSQKTRRELSKQYANAIAAFFWNAGVPHRRLIVRGYGARHAIASNRTVAGSAFNRRVEVVVGG